jgi:hypothetical protein
MEDSTFWIKKIENFKGRRKGRSIIGGKKKEKKTTTAPAASSGQESGQSAGQEGGGGQADVQSENAQEENAQQQQNTKKKKKKKKKGLKKLKAKEKKPFKKDKPIWCHLRPVNKRNLKKPSGWHNLFEWILYLIPCMIKKLAEKITDLLKGDKKSIEYAKKWFIRSSFEFSYIFIAYYFTYCIFYNVHIEKLKGIEDFLYGNGSFSKVLDNGGIMGTMGAAIKKSLGTKFPSETTKSPVGGITNGGGMTSAMSFLGQNGAQTQESEMKIPSPFNALSAVGNITGVTPLFTIIALRCDRKTFSRRVP